MGWLSKGSLLSKILNLTLQMVVILLLHKQFNKKKLKGQIFNTIQVQIWRSFYKSMSALTSKRWRHRHTYKTPSIVCFAK